jgi:hypothetical protein
MDPDKGRGQSVLGTNLHKLDEQARLKAAQQGIWLRVPRAPRSSIP